MILELTGNLLLFCLVFGMSATADTKSMKSQITNKSAIFTGIFLQFIILPFLGFVVVKFLNMSEAMGVTLLVVTSSPGGSYSNWWCSIFNADLALSVTMTAISTFLSVIMLPLNLFLYAKLTFEDDVVASLDWPSLFVSLIVVISAILGGVFISAHVHSFKFNIIANKIGNVAGILLVLFSVLVSSSSQDSRLWNRDPIFYASIALPCILGLIVANIITSYLGLPKAERVTVSIECCYQNVGIATTVAMTMFKNDDLAEAMGVPVFYGIVEAIVLAVYCIIAWKMGWTKAPRNESLWTIIYTSYEIIEAEMKELKVIEVVHVNEARGDLETSSTMESEGGGVLTHYIQLCEGCSPVIDFVPPGPKELSGIAHMPLGGVD